MGKALEATRDWGDTGAYSGDLDSLAEKEGSKEAKEGLGLHLSPHVGPDRIFRGSE